MAASPLSMASVRSHGRHRAGLPEERLEVVHLDRGPDSVGGGQRVEQAGQPAHVPAQVLAQPGRGRAVEADRRPSRCSASHWRPGRPGAHRGVRPPRPPAPPTWPGRPGSCRPRPPAPATWWQGVVQVGGQAGAVGRVEPPGVADHHHPALDQERWGGAGVDHQRPRRARRLPGRRTPRPPGDGSRPAHQPLDQGVGGLGHQRGVVPLDQVGRRCTSVAVAGTVSPRPVAPRSASGPVDGGQRVADLAVPATSWTRTTRQPSATPRAAAASEAVPRSPISRPSTTPEEGLVRRREQQRVAELGQRLRGPQQGERLVGRLAQVEPGVEDDAVGGEPGGRGPGGPLEQEGATASTTSS